MSQHLKIFYKKKFGQVSCSVFTMQGKNMDAPTENEQNIILITLYLHLLTSLSIFLIREMPSRWFSLSWDVE